MSALKKGDKGSDVKRMQGLLAKTSAKPKVKATGTFDGDTDKAVRDFQKKNGLKVDGTVGKKTLEALEAGGVKPEWTIKDTNRPAGHCFRIKVDTVLRHGNLTVRAKQEFGGKDAVVYHAMKDYGVEIEIFESHFEKLIALLNDIEAKRRRFEKTRDAAAAAKIFEAAKRSYAEAERLEDICQRLMKKVDAFHKQTEKVLDERSDLAA